MIYWAAGSRKIAGAFSEEVRQFGSFTPEGLIKFLECPGYVPHSGLGVRIRVCPFLERLAAHEGDAP
ncbi:hypothetical protein GCM10010228_05240 [Streptomyces massasporeus]|nr:hypothetical protein GCM10010228_05240 [Streptomyces massasporeus]